MKILVGLQRKALAFSCLLSVGALPGLGQNAPNQAANQNAQSPGSAHQPKAVIKLPTLPTNALTPADKNFGGTSIYLIDKKSQEKLKSQPPAPPKAKSQVPATTPPAKKKDAVIINTGADAASTKLVPQSFFDDDIDHLQPAVFMQSAPQSTYRPVALEGGTSIALHMIQVAENRSDFYVFTVDGQSISTDLLGKGHPIVVGNRSTVISTNENMITLHAGDLLVDTGSSGVRIGNREAGIKLLPQSTVLINYQPGSTMRIVCLADSSGEGVKAKAAKSPNDDVVISVVRAMTIDASGSRLEKFDVSSLAQSDSLIATAGNACQKFGRLRSHIGSICSAAAPHSPTPNEPARVIAAGGSEFYVTDSGAIDLSAGWLFVDAPATSVVSTDLGKVFFKKNGCINIQQVQGYFRVASCSGAGAVVATFAGYKVPLDAGEEVLFTDHTPSSSEIAAGDGILRRRLRSAKLSGNNHAVLDDFSIYSMLYNVEHMKPLRRAATREDEKLQTELIKTLAHLQFTTGDRGEYTEAPQVSGQLPGNRELKKELISSGSATTR